MWHRSIEAFAHGIYLVAHTDWSAFEGKVQKVFELRDETMEPIHKRIVSFTDEKPAKVWHLPRVQDELKKQMKLLKLIGDLAQIDEQHIEALRQKLVSHELVGTAAPLPEPSIGLTNEAIFERYRSRIEPDLKRNRDWVDNLHAQGLNTGEIISVYLRDWVDRYVRRKNAIEKGPMIDVTAHRALLAKYATHDAATQVDPRWDQDTRSWIEFYYQNRHMGLDVNSPEKPHCYGPSLRQLWIEARLPGDSDEDLWKSVLQWAHQPTTGMGRGGST